MATRTERDIVLQYTNHWFAHSEWSIERFAYELLAPALVAAKLVEDDLEQTDGEAWTRQRKAWATRVGRIFNGTSPFPLEWKWVWVNVLPAEYAAQIRRDCLELIGVLDIRAPIVGPGNISPTQANLGEVIHEFGSFVQAATPAHDGRYCLEDDPKAVDHMLREGADVVSALVTELLAVSAGTGRSVPLLSFLVAATRQQVARHG